MYLYNYIESNAFVRRLSYQVFKCSTNGKADFWYTSEIRWRFVCLFLVTCQIKFDKQEV